MMTDVSASPYIVDTLLHDVFFLVYLLSVVMFVVCVTL